MDFNLRTVFLWRSGAFWRVTSRDGHALELFLRDASFNAFIAIGRWKSRTGSLGYNGLPWTAVQKGWKLLLWTVPFRLLSAISGPQSWRNQVCNWVLPEMDGLQVESNASGDTDITDDEENNRELKSSNSDNKASISTEPVSSVKKETRASPRPFSKICGKSYIWKRLCAEAAAVRRLPLYSHNTRNHFYFFYLNRCELPFDIP